jgi:hypothetical protein
VDSSGSSFGSAFVMFALRCDGAVQPRPLRASQAQTGIPADDDAASATCCAGSAWSGLSCTARLPVLLFATQHHFDGSLGACVGRAAETLTQLHQQVCGEFWSRTHHSASQHGGCTSVGRLLEPCTKQCRMTTRLVGLSRMIGIACITAPGHSSPLSCTLRICWAG